MKVRIGIDVGGTFTDAVAINNDTYELIGSVKAPTTVVHSIPARSIKSWKVVAKPRQIP